ncbi:hypothetical protein SAMN05518855_101127 [Paenibacillus sp. CF384]|nr:hypothetical protein SAMN05518855_101127 [Paenibacillus sp. CF384]
MEERSVIFCANELCKRFPDLHAVVYSKGVGKTLSSAK